MNDRFFTLESNITKSDYKKLLYMFAFRNTRLMVQAIIFIAIILIVSLLNGNPFELGQIIVFFVFFACVSRGIEMGSILLNKYIRISGNKLCC